MFLSIILIPAYVLLAALFPANDRLVEASVSDTPFEKISQAILITLFLMGLARLLYALFFQPDERQSTGETEAAHLNAGPSSPYALPSAQGEPVSSFGSWRVSTDELAVAPAVKEGTTNSFEKM
jgi:hypothetical protein